MRLETSDKNGEIRGSWNLSEVNIATGKNVNLEIATHVTTQSLLKL